MAKKATEKDAPPSTRLTKGDVVVQTTLATEVAELKSHGFTVDDGTKASSTGTTGTTGTTAAAASTAAARPGGH